MSMPVEWPGGLSYHHDLCFSLVVFFLIPQHVAVISDLIEGQLGGASTSSEAFKIGAGFTGYVSSSHGRIHYRQFM